MERIIGLGELVQYTGDESYADSYTQFLMNRYLTKYNWYEITDIKHFPLFGIHYLIQVTKASDPYWYPSKSFALNNRKYMKDKYNLR